MASGGAVLVIGADGTVGSAVAARLEAAGISVIRTSRRGTAGSEPLDLAALPPTWSPPSGIASAVLCAAVTSTDACRDRSAECWRVNVEATLDVGRRLASSGARVVFPSTNMVFDGSVPYTPAWAPRCPRTAYGRMKAEAEEGLLSLGTTTTTIVRLTKVVGRALAVVERWREALGRGEPIQPLLDLVMAPVSLELAAQVMAAAALDSFGGIIQVSARADISYADAARQLAARWGASPGLVRPATVAELGLPLEHVPAHTTLDAASLRDRLGLASPDPWAAIDEVA
jgi:dTDP-4-dehydrorhamnose reductase